MKKGEIITVVLSLAFGFGIGWACRPFVSPEEVRAKNVVVAALNTAASGTENALVPARVHPSPSALPASGNNATPKSTDIVRIPLSLIDSAMPVFLSSGDMKNLGLMLMTYNLPSDRYKTLLTGVRDVFTEMQAAEAAHSRLVTTPGGDQYFVVEPFAAEGAELQKRLQSLIEESFEGIEDDRRAVFQRQLNSSGLFYDFGKTPKEISIDETAGDDGLPRYSLTIRPPPNSKVSEIFGTSSVPLDQVYLRNRYGNLIDKNVKPQ